MFVKLLLPETLIGDRCYPKDSVVEVEEARGKDLVEGKAAVPSDGPASEPDRETPKVAAPKK